MMENRPLRMKAMMKAVPKNLVLVICFQSSNTPISPGSLPPGHPPAPTETIDLN